MATMAVVSARGRYSGGGSRSSVSHSYSRPSRVSTTTRTTSTYHPPALSARPTVTKTTTSYVSTRPSTVPTRTTTVTHVYRPSTYTTSYIGHTYQQPTVVFAPTWGYSPTDGFGWSLYHDYSQPAVTVVRHHHHTSLASLIIASIVIFAIFCLFCIICFAAVAAERQEQHESEEIIVVERDETAESQGLLKRGDEEDVVEEQIIYEYHPDGGMTEHRTQVVTKYEYTEHNDFPEEPAHAIAIGKPMPPNVAMNCNMPQMSTAGTSAMSYPSHQQQQMYYGQPQVPAMNGPMQGAPVGITVQPQQMPPMQQQQPYYANNGGAMYYNNVTV